MGFRNKLILLLVGILIALQAITAIVSYMVLRSNAIAEGKRELASASVVLKRQLGVLSDRVGDEVNVLALDYPLRQAIANEDRDTVLSALRNHGRRVGATRMILVGLDGKVVDDTAEERDTGSAFPFPSLIEDSRSGDRAATLAAFDGGIYWILVAPVKAPVPIAFIAAFVPIDDALLTKLQELEAFPNAMALAIHAPAGGWKIVAATANFHPVVHAPAAGMTGAPRTEVTIRGGARALTWTARLDGAPESAPVIAVLDYPLSAALRGYRSVVLSMLFALICVLLVAFICAMPVARNFARPIEMLAETARRIAQGDYSVAPRIEQAGEIGALSQALAHMTESIAEREQALRHMVAELAVARDEAVRANDAKSQFLANMSHELRTPLNAIIGFSELMVAEMMGPIGNERYAEYLKDIHASGGRLLKLVNDVLDLARVEAGTFTVERAPVAFDLLLDETLSALDSAARAAHVEIAVKGNPSSWPTLAADKAKLSQAIGNLIHNAIKFTPAGGRVTIAVEPKPSFLSVKIIDTGIGMQPEDAQTVVKPFQRLAPAFEGKYQGPGLGLPFAKAVVELHGGTLSIASAPELGTTVTIELPLARAGSDRRIVTAA